MPLIFIGVQIFGAAGWGWTTANLGRISCFAYSLAIYMATIGPLTHMQAERRAFWILRTVPVPLGSLLAAKARAWAVIVGGIAAVVFAVMSFSLNDTSITARVGAGLLVTAGAAGMSFVAVAMASGGADLSDDTGTAVGPATIYAFMFVGGLFNVLLLGDAATRVAGLALYAFAGWTYWQAGVEQAGFCLDAEAVRARRVRAADAGTMLIVYALGGSALLSAGTSMGLRGLELAILRLPLTLLIGVAAAIYLARRPPAAESRPLPRLLLLAAGLGVAAEGVILARGGARGPLPVIALAVLAALVEELVLRGILQRSISTLRIRAAVISSVVGVVAALSLLRPAPAGVSPGGVWPGGVGVDGAAIVATIVVLAVGHAAAAVAYAFTGRVAAAWLARVVLLLALAVFASFA